MAKVAWVIVGAVAAAEVMGVVSWIEPKHLVEMEAGLGQIVPESSAFVPGRASPWTL